MADTITATNCYEISAAGKRYVYQCPYTASSGPMSALHYHTAASLSAQDCICKGNQPVGSRFMVTLTRVGGMFGGDSRPSDAIINAGKNGLLW
jgi:hypothetical protein